MQFLSKKTNLVKSGILVMAIAIAGVNYAQSNNSSASRAMELVKISKAYADCTPACYSSSGTCTCETGDGVSHDITNASHN